jgi:hypothetical protein
VLGGAGIRSALRALSPQPATLRVATFPLQGKVGNSAHVAALGFDKAGGGSEERRNVNREKS